MLQIFYHPKARKELLDIPKKFRLRIIEKVTELLPLEHPLQHRDVIKLRGRTNDFRLRSGDYRIIFTVIKTKTIHITRIEHRQAGY